MKLKNYHTLEEVQKIFSDDKFATEAAGAIVTAFDICYAKCELEIKPIHLNARGAVMGGVMFTLADFAMAVASNGYREECDTVGIDAAISYLKPAKGTKLIAEAKCVKPGRVLSFYEVAITDDLGTDVAHFTGKTFTIQPK